MSCYNLLCNTQLIISYNDVVILSFYNMNLTPLLQNDTTVYSPKYQPGKHRIAVDTVDLQQTTSLESAITSLTRQYSILINLQKHKN